MTFIAAAADRGPRVVRVVLMAGLAVGGWGGLAVRPDAAAAVRRSDAAPGLVPFSGWVGRLPADEEETWKLREALAFYRGRFGIWMEAELQAASTRLPVVRQFELRVALARAARYNEEWDRARGWITAAGEVLARVPEAERTWRRLADYYAEAGALRELTDVRVAYAGLKPFLDGELSPAECFEIYRRLVDITVVSGDSDNYAKLATAWLTAARAWSEALPAAPGEPAAADRAVAAYADTLLRRGQVDTALGFLDLGIANPTLRAAIVAAAADARAATESDETIVSLLRDLPTPRQRLERLAGTSADSPGLVIWLLRHNRLDLILSLLARDRDELWDDVSLADREWRDPTWNDVAWRAIVECFQVGRPADAVRLAELYRQDRHPNLAPDALSSKALVRTLVDEGRLLDLDDGLVAIAELLGTNGETEPARRLLVGLPFDYPHRVVVVTNSAGERAMRERAAEIRLRQQRVALVSAWAAAGDSERARELLGELSRDNVAGGGQGDAVRQRLLAEIAAAAAIQGESNVAAQLLEDARAARPAAVQVPVNSRVALVTAQVLASQGDEAWDEVKAAGADALSVVNAVVQAVLMRGRCNQVLEWVSAAPDEYRPILWPAFFRFAIPDPAVPPVAPPQ